MRPINFLFLVFSSICFLTSCNGQVKKNAFLDKNDTTISRKLQDFRQKFWDSLPKPTSWTKDYEELFSENERNQLDSIIGLFEKETNNQFSIITLDTFCTSKEKFNDLALHIFNSWGVGQKEKNNGVTITICSGYRLIRICNGYGIEKFLSDLETKEILNKYFTPKFKEGNYFQGTKAGLIALIETIRLKQSSD